MATNKYKCKRCGYVHEGPKVPIICPLCKAPSSEFELLIKAKKGINTSGNMYTIMYAAVMVIIVAAVLAFTAQTLKQRQKKNIETDKMIQILASMKVPANSENAESLYTTYVQEALIVNSNGDVCPGKGFDIDIASEFKKTAGTRELPVFVCSTEGVTRYVFPVYGAGLWGPIWGFVCLNNDMNTVYGTYFSHKGETPGLGAEIDKLSFQQQFEGKHLFKEGKFLSIAVMKVGQKALNGEDQVDAISGGTITSKGVEAMLFSSLEPYKEYLQKRVAELPKVADTVIVVVEDSIIVQ